MKYLSAVNNVDLQYRSKVSYHLSFRVLQDATLVSRDEILVSRDSVKRTFWNKLQAISL